MADNVAITAGSGVTVATDEVTINSVSVQVQRVKLIDSQDGGSGPLFPAPAANGDALANPTVTLIGEVAYLYSPSGGTAQWDRARTPNVFKTVDLTAATAETTIWTPASGRKFRLMGLVLKIGSTASKLTFRDNTAGTIIVIIDLAASGLVNLTGLGNGLLSAAANNVLTVTRSGSTALAGTLWGTEE